VPTCILRIVLLTGAALALVAQPASAQAAPLPLEGESFNAAKSGASNVGELDVDFDCPAGTFAFDAAGPATGPYPGTYSETGSSTFDPFPEPDPGAFFGHAIRRLRIRFTINSSTGDVVGVKSLGRNPSDPDVPSGARCGAGQFERFALFANLFYTALIRTDEGVFLDGGFAAMFARVFPDLTDPDTDGSTFDEFFSVPFEPEPTRFTKHDCQAKQNAALVAELFPGGKKECKDFVKGKDKKDK
jgi:hypothetical protein